MAITLTAFCLCTATVAAQAEDVINSIQAMGTTQAFTKETVANADLNTILTAGLSATSSMNTQPQFFAVVSNQEIMDEIAGSMGLGGAPTGMTLAGDAPAGSDLPEGATPPSNSPAGSNQPVPPTALGAAKASLGDSPVAIIVYMDESNAMDNPAFDCGLACQNIVIAAGALGYGVKIVSSSTIALNGENHDALCAKLGVNTSLKAVAVLIVGHADASVDGVSSATTRSAIDEKVCFVK